MSAMVTDSRPVTDPELGSVLTEPVRPAARTRNTRFLRALLDEALGFRPPTGLAPVAALARWVAIVTCQPGGNTPERLRRGAEHRLLTTDEAQTLAGAFEASYALVLDREVDALRAGATATTFLAPGELGHPHPAALAGVVPSGPPGPGPARQHWLARLEQAIQRAGAMASAIRGRSAG